MLHSKPSLKVNAIMNTILTLSTFVFAILTFPYASRILLPEGTGKVSFAKSVVSYFMLFAQLGIPTYGVRECAKVRDNRKEMSQITKELFFLNLISTAIVYLVFLITVFTVPRFHEETALFLITGVAIIFNCFSVNWMFQAIEKYTYITVRTLVFLFIALVAMFLMVKKKEDYVIYAGVIAFGSYASSIVNFICSNKYIDWFSKCKIDIKRHLKGVLVFFAMASASTIYTHLDAVMLGMMKTNTDVGYYDAAVKIKSILVTVVTSLGVVLLPRASYYINNNQKNDFKRIINKSLDFIVMVSLPLISYFIIFADNGIYFLSGSAYEGSIIPMRIIMPTILFIGMSNVTGIQALIPLGKEKSVLLSEIIGAVIDFVINLILIPRYAAAGAAIGTLIAEFVVWAIQYSILKREMENLYRNTPWIKIIIGVMIATCISFLFRFIYVGNFMKLLMSAAIFGCVYLCVLTYFRIPLVIELENSVVSKSRAIRHRKG